jgi:hypothetical protein
MTSDAKPRASDASLQPSTREHGVWGTKSDAVGGFGEGYSAQVAHGSEPNLADSEEEAAEDAPLGREVRKTLGRAHVDAADLRVAVRAGHVTLLGSVRNELEKAQIEARARAVPGVAEVTNRLNVLSDGDPAS